MSGRDMNYCFDEFGRVYLCDEDDNPYSGPYDTLEQAEESFAACNQDDED